MTWKPCQMEMVIDDLVLRCDSPYGDGHEGAHHDPDAHLRWKPDPDVMESIPEVPDAP